MANCKLKLIVEQKSFLYLHLDNNSIWF